jgi:hypothetical protein
MITYPIKATRRSAVTARLCTAVIAAMVVTESNAQFILSDFNAAGDDGTWDIAGDISGVVENGEFTATTAGGFKNILQDGIPRSGTSIPNAEVTATEMLASPILEWDWRHVAGESSGTFINNFVVFNTDANGFGGYKVLADSVRFINPGTTDSGTFRYSFESDPVGFAALQSYSEGAGTYFVVHFVQQTNDNSASVVHYGEFRLIPEPGSALLLGIGGLTALARRRRC